MKRVIMVIITFALITGTALGDSIPLVKAKRPEPELPFIPPVVIEKQKEEEIKYPEADYIWNYLKDLGYSDYVCAGILGNIMVEVGGNTLILDVLASNKNYYGFCQWSRKYYPEVIGKSLEEQCDFLSSNIEYELNTFGCGYETFLKKDSSRAAALSFSKGYERCGKNTYSLRQDCAEIAYNYFVKGVE